MCLVRKIIYQCLLKEFSLENSFVFVTNYVQCKDEELGESLNYPVEINYVSFNLALFNKTQANRYMK